MSQFVPPSPKPRIRPVTSPVTPSDEDFSPGMPPTPGYSTSESEPSYAPPLPKPRRAPEPIDQMSHLVGTGTGPEAYASPPSDEDFPPGMFPGDMPLTPGYSTSESSSSEPSYALPLPKPKPRRAPEPVDQMSQYLVGTGPEAYDEDFSPGMFSGGMPTPTSAPSYNLPLPNLEQTPYLASDKPSQQLVGTDPAYLACFVAVIHNVGPAKHEFYGKVYDFEYNLVNHKRDEAQRPRTPQQYTAKHPSPDLYILQEVQMPPEVPEFRQRTNKQTGILFGIYSTVTGHLSYPNREQTRVKTLSHGCAVVLNEQRFEELQTHHVHGVTKPRTSALVVFQDRATKHVYAAMSVHAKIVRKFDALYLDSVVNFYNSVHVAVGQAIQDFPNCMFIIAGDFNVDFDKPTAQIGNTWTAWPTKFRTVLDKFRSRMAFYNVSLVGAGKDIMFVSNHLMPEVRPSTTSVSPRHPLREKPRQPLVADFDHASILVEFCPAGLAPQATPQIRRDKSLRTAVLARAQADRSQKKRLRKKAGKMRM
jgi:endonuclease/exonuclease/phosphatase family metal-dependent hydrolase